MESIDEIVNHLLYVLKEDVIYNLRITDPIKIAQILAGLHDKIDSGDTLYFFIDK